MNADEHRSCLAATPARSAPGPRSAGASRLNALMVILATAIALGAVPPLTDDQVIRLETAADGYDVREEAFFALIENAREWTNVPGDEPVRLRPDFDAMLAEPERFRGDLCLIEGRLVQQGALESPYDLAREWFIRDETGRPIAVYVVNLDNESAERFRDGLPVRIYARFYKRMSETARDGEVRSYPAFVGAHPQLLFAPPRHGLANLWVVLLPVMILLGVFAVLFAYIREQKRRAMGDRPRRLLRAEGEEVEVESLPDDPAEALAELERRSESSRPRDG